MGLSEEIREAGQEVGAASKWRPGLRALTRCFRYDRRIVTRPMFEAERIAGSDFEPNRLIEFLRPPFRKFEFSTPMSTAHAARVLDEIVEPPRKWGWPTSAKRGDFEGRVAGTHFKINRIIQYQNSFIPIIEGNFRRDGLGTVVTVNMRLVWPVVPVWIGIIAFLAWNSVSVDSPIAGPFGVRIAVIAMTLFIYLVATVPFAIEVGIATRRLLELLRAGDTSSGLTKIG